MTFDSLSLKDIITYTVEIIATLSVFVEISPIKLNPWSSLAKWVGKAVNKDLYDQMAKHSERLDAIEKSIQKNADKEDARAATAARNRIVCFGDDILNGQAKTKDHFHQILIDIDDYTEYCESHPGYRNSVAEHTIKQIENEYDLCLKGVHNFL